MTRRILAAAILIPSILASILLFPLSLFLTLLTVFFFRALQEFSRLASASGSTLSPVSYILALGIPWIVNYAPDLTLAWSLGGTLITLGGCAFFNRARKAAFQNVAGNILGLCYLTPSFLLIATFHAGSPYSEGSPKQAYALIFVLLLVWTSDAAALFVGRTIGKHRLTPSISPNKTVEGFIAAVSFPIAAASLMGGYFLPERSLPFFLSAGLVVACAGIAGDLFESVLKRGAGLKDTSNLIPGHGGVLDRIDSLLFAVPAYYLLAILTG